MPTVIALDVSLSMSRHCFTGASGVPHVSKRKLAVLAVNQFLDHISTHCKLEFIALLTFSSECRVITESFTRNVDVIRDLLDNLEEVDSTNYEATLDGILNTVIKQWSLTLPVEIFLITDGSPGFGPGCLRDAIGKAKRFPFPAKMNILSLSDPGEKNYTENIKMLHQLIEVTSGEGSVYLPENHLNSKGVSSAVARLCAKDFTPYKGILRSGLLSSKITLCPPPQPYVSRSEEKRYDISEVIEIIGFIDLNDLASPSAHSRHLLLPLKTTDLRVPSGPGEPMEIDDDSEGNVPNFCVLLHGSLKVENFCAICEVGPDWFGFIYSWADNKKKSNLMLSILPPGADVVPWLGNLRELGPKTEELCKLPGNAAYSFPVKPVDKRSYVCNPTVWLNGDEGIYSDIQKLLRHARKIPEKTQAFYKELNRMRRWALALGFIDILERIAGILERECIMSTSPNPHTTIELTHAITQIRTVHDYTKSVVPMTSTPSRPIR